MILRCQETPDSNREHLERSCCPGHGSVPRPVAGEAEQTWARQWLGSCSENSCMSDRFLQILRTHQLGDCGWLPCTSRGSPLPRPLITQGRKVQRPSVCVYPSFYTHQLIGAGRMARTQYRFSPLFKRSLSANNMLGSVLSAGDTGQRGRGSSYNFQGQYV